MFKPIVFILASLISFASFGQSLPDCSLCSQQVITEKQIEGKSMETLALLRNEIYARKGYVFTEMGQYDNYFSHQSWYKPVKSNNSIQLSAIEKQNVAFLKAHEKQLQAKRDVAINNLKTLKER